MIQPVDPLIEAFAQAGSDIITVHVEACPHLDRTLRLIRSHGCKVGVALNPATPEGSLAYVLDIVDLVLVMSVNPGFGGQTFISQSIDKIRRLRTLLGARPVDIEVDGGVGPDNARHLVDAGAAILVAGSAVFRTPDYAANIAALR
jgi:ribulose-phosphate 3-epimerase